MASTKQMRVEMVREVLAENRDRFLGYLRARLGRQTAAEDVLQSAYIKAIERAADLESPESVIPWFRRILSNEMADYFRHAARERRALAVVERELEVGATSEPEGKVCGCVSDVLPTLKPEYAAAVRAVDVEGVPVEQLAKGSGITSNNASVRLHRARASLRKKLVAVCGSCAGTGCLDCSCSPAPAV